MLSGAEMDAETEMPLSFLFIVADQLPAHALGFANDPNVDTPHLDALAASSMVFDRTFVANPICMPNRASMITGRLPSSHGVRVNGIPLDRNHDTFVRTLRRHGYRTGTAGKLHLQPYGAAPEVAALLVGPHSNAVADANEAGWDTWERRSLHDAARVTLPTDYYGFDEVDLVVGAADTATGHYRHWLRERGFDPDDVQGRANALETCEDWEQVYRTAVPADAYPTSYIAESTTRFLKHSASCDQPFVFWSSFPDPHHPFTPPSEYFDRYRPDDIDLAATFGDNLADAPPHLRELVEHRGKQGRPFDCFAPTEKQLRHSLAAAYGMITMLDDAVGTIMATLHDTGLADRTVVIFTSDHGDMWGEHGLLLKHAVHYESCTRVPLTIHVPGLPAGRTDALASSLDLAPTVLSLANVEPYRDLHGRDLGPLLEAVQSRSGWRDHVLIEEDEIFGVPRLEAPIRMRTLVTAHARLTHYSDQSFGELYDLRNDPREMRNLFHEASAKPLRSDMTERLLSAIVSSQDGGVAPRFTA